MAVVSHKMNGEYWRSS